VSILFWLAAVLQRIKYPRRERRFGEAQN